MKITDISEGINIDNGELSFDYNSPTGQPTKFGKRKLEPFVSSNKEIRGNRVISIHLKKGDNFVNIVKALKRKNDITVDPEDYNYFIKRTAIYASRIIRQQNTDAIVTVKSSHQLIDDLLSEIISRMPHLQTYPSSFIKQTNIQDIQITDDERISDKIRNSLQRVIDRAQESGSFEIKKIPPQYRKFITNVFQPSKPSILEKFKDKNVCVLDDVFSSGFTIVQIIDQIQKYHPQSIYGLCIFKTK